MADWTWSLGEAPGDAAVVGHKAASLVRLAREGFPVPPGLVVSTEAFRAAVGPYRDRIAESLARGNPADPDGARVAADEIARCLAGLRVPGAAADAVRASLAQVGDGPVAVRSSATAEDRADASFAGQYETALGVRGADSILDAIAACWRSFFAAHALAVRAALGMTGTDEAMAVLIQPMIDAECSGVCFSADPVHGTRDVVVNAAWGLGPGVVDGAVSADTARLRRPGFAVEDRRIVEKAAQVVLGPDGGTTVAAVSEERRRSACLPHGWLTRVAQFAIAAENLFGAPQDVEWAISGERIWILQSRPVTGLSADLAAVPPFPVEWERAEDRRFLWNLGWESRVRVLLPFERAAVAAAESAWDESILANGGDFEDHLEIADRLTINGREYSRARPSTLHAGDGRIRRAARQDLAARLREAGVTPWEHYAPEVLEATRRLAEFDREAADGSGLADHLEDALGALRRHWVVHWQMATMSGHFTKPFRQTFATISGRPQKEAGDASVPLLEGAGNVFTRMMDGLCRLAEIARGLPEVAALLADGPDAGMARLAAVPDAGPLRAELAAFLEVYGDRSGVGFGSWSSLLTPTWREEPRQVLAMAALYLSPEIETPEMARARANRERDAQVDALCAGCADEAAVAEFRRWLPLMRRERTDLENHNQYIDQMSFGQLRQAARAVGQWLATHGAIEDPEDVFWLGPAEGTAALRGDPVPGYADLVLERKADHAAWSALTPPPILGLPESRLDARPEWKDEVTPDAAEEPGLLRGQAASAGRRRGRARVVAQTARMPDVGPGEILVTENAGPSWTPIFPILGGIVLEEGVLFQHAATAAREYGVPAVLNAKDATRRIPDGAWITVDGTAGTVEVE